MKNERSNSIFLSEGINVLSLFDGMSCGQIALNKLGIKVNNYFASEIDRHAIKVTQSNYPNTIQIGDSDKMEKFLFPDTRKKRKDCHPTKHKFGSPSLQASLRCQTHAFFATARRLSEICTNY